MKTINKYTVILLTGSATLIWILISFTSSIRTADVTLTIGDSTSYRGSHENLVEVSLDNPDVRVRGIQIEICDVDNYVSCAGCGITDRTSRFTCVSNEKKNGCYEVILFSFTDLIEAGKGPIFTFKCDVAEEAPGDECRNLIHGKVKIADKNKESLDVAVEQGKICFNDCFTSEDCDVGLWCYDNKTCANGACQSIERCPDDGLYCNGLEYCDEDNDKCRNTPDPCMYCYSYGCTCDEREDSCAGYNTDEDGESI